ncbi:Spindle-body formation-associated protein [Apiospora hydei]|uniref:Spindle-body formation-associated protein n=1 Tax=Apiospora hydei TaxID=1337664 RepID=A0ABR1V560_9PEZI
MRSQTRRVYSQNLQTTGLNHPQITPETYWHPYDSRNRHLTPEASLVWSRDPAKTERCSRAVTYETPAPKKDDDMSEEDWEDDDGADVTIDLNEPKSNSGRYWKSQFNKYHADAREEMSKLVKHKHLSRMYAQQKDIENTELQERVKELERQVRLKDDEIKQAQKRPALTRTTSVASASSRERQDSENWVAERARQSAEREVARLEREVATLKKENADLRRENEIIKANASDSAQTHAQAQAQAYSQAQVYRTTSAMTSERAAAAKARVAQKRRERAALRAS